MRLTRRDFLRSTINSSVTPEGTSRVQLITVSSLRILTCGDTRSPCAVGWSGIRLKKREGDGATPAGLYPLRRLLFRQDRLIRPATGLQVDPIKRQDGWCTNPNDPDYNQQITLPRRGQYENLWRNDSLYDVIIVIGYNDGSNMTPGKGSAIFLHVARPAMSPTDGCIAIPLNIMRLVANNCDNITLIEIKD